VVELRRQGFSLRAIAVELLRRGLKTRQEWPHWSAVQVAADLVIYPDPPTGETGENPNPG
jgi:hypothetical protein